ncbi:hypothetical protein FNL55_12755 [Tardiphaga sp. vice352]|uniref:Pam3-gp28 family putative phage holin n=1 Tax=Tardiphaga sp. vice352 TaxID=2592816 RepID=UPI001161D231|nr:hypothetical protein [Tardiphaga sp. vice352]QDM32109.1 hypothetical protein FNL55_12755 [Tardiphaga sp. vice352]
MKWDSIWQILRYILIAGGGFLTGKGYITAEQVTTIVGAIGSVGAILWGLFVKAGTTAVPDAVAARADVPTVSAATGAVTQ